VEEDVVVDNRENRENRENRTSKFSVRRLSGAPFALYRNGKSPGVHGSQSNRIQLFVDFSPVIRTIFNVVYVFMSISSML